MLLPRSRPAFIPDTHTEPDTQTLRAAVHAVQDAIATQLLGKEAVIQQALECLLAQGHVLFEDPPGVGKTTLARLLAHHLGMDTQRVQCTADLLPGDLVGVAVYDRATAAFRFHRGPVFTEILLVDEINRAPPRTQSGLLEAMAERQVTVDRTTHPLPEPFFVLATQNPLDRLGTHVLPESEMDRFLMRLHLGYPAAAAETDMLLRPAAPPCPPPAWSRDGLRAAQRDVATVRLARPVASYIQRLLAATRTDPAVPALSPRAGLAIVAAARSHAWLAGRSYVLPDDVRAVFTSVSAHRLGVEGRSRTAHAIEITPLEA